MILKRSERRSRIGSEDQANLGARGKSWIESPRFVRLMKRLIGRPPFVKWATVTKEAAALADEVRNKRRAWPPASAGALGHALQSAPSAVAKFDPMSPRAPCPSVVRKLTAATTGALAGAGLSPEVRPVFLDALALYHPVMLWRQHSRRVLQIHWQLFEDLANGERPTIKGEELVFPFPACYIIPPGITTTDPPRSAASPQS